MNNQLRENNDAFLQPHDALLAGCQLSFPHLLQISYFSFKTPEEATSLACTLANMCGVAHKPIELGLNEVFLNAIEHGNLCINNEEKSLLKKDNLWHLEINKRLQDPLYEYKTVDVILEQTPTLITIKVIDQGNGFDWREFIKNPFSVTRSYHGRGLLVAQSLCFDHVDFSDKGNEIICFINRENS